MTLSPTEAEDARVSRHHPPWASGLVFAAIVSSTPVALAAGSGQLEKADCTGLRGWVAIDGDPTTAIDVVFVFDGAPGDAGAVEHPILASVSREDLCSAHGCDHGFELPLPLAVMNGLEHTVHAYASDGSIGQAPVEVAMSPAKVTCPLLLPQGVRRKLPADAASAWHFSPFWDELAVSKGILSAYAEADPLSEAPRVLMEAKDRLWLVDDLGGVAQKRLLPTQAWSSEAAPSVSGDAAATELASLPEGPALLDRPFVLLGEDGAVYLIDTPPGSSGGPGSGGGGAGGTGSDPEDGESGCSITPERSSAHPFAPLMVLGLGVALFARKLRLSR